MIKKTYAYGIRGNAFKLLKSYLTSRTQYVFYVGVQSATLPIKCGVPQGSILGPLLFICSKNDIGNISDFLYTILYADDTSVLLNGNNYSNLIKLLNSELEKLSIWLKSNNLTLNVQKTYYMVFHRSRIKLTLMLLSPWIMFVFKELIVSNILGLYSITNSTGPNILITSKTKFPRE